MEAQEDDLILDLDQILPPPHIEGKVVSVRMDGETIFQISPLNVRRNTSGDFSKLARTRPVGITSQTLRRIAKHVNDLAEYPMPDARHTRSRPCRRIVPPLFPWHGKSRDQSPKLPLSSIA
jgi:hypothetical protein